VYTTDVGRSLALAGRLRAACYDESELSQPPVASPKAPISGDLLAEILPLLEEINAVLDPDALLSAIADQLRRIIDYTFLDIFLPQDDGTLKAAHAVGYELDPASFQPRPGEGIVGAAAELREPVFVPDVSKDPRYRDLLPGVAAELAIPLIHRNRLVGVLNIEGPDAEAFTPEAQTALQVLASHLAQAIANATLHRETRRYAELLAWLQEIGRETASILDLDELLHGVAANVKRVIDYEMFGILLLDPRTDELVLRKSVRYADSPEKPRIKLGQGLCGTAAQTKQPVLVGDVLSDPRYLRLIPQTRSELVVPLIHKDRVIGVFDLESTQLDRFTEEHVKLLTPLANQVAVAIENARLYEELQRKEERVQRELKIAQRVQHGLFPEECPRGPGWEASAHFLPARELGGDLYDFFHLEGGRIGLALGDVSGKGVPAALYGAFASGTVRGKVFQGREPADILASANRTLRKRGVEGFYCTLAYAEFDFSARQLRLVNSGLPYPLHYRTGRGRCELLAVAGLPLGTFDESSYDELKVSLAPGDVLVFFSDGVTEAWNGTEEYDVARLAREVEKHAGLPAPRIGERVLEDLNRFVGEAPPPDDVTLVVVKVL
jgi:sigma-B regulation protein RsbU (phosphoserine phosphatase)